MDLDRYREPPRDPAELAERRAALLEQLGWLADEAGALAPLLRGLPAWALEGAPTPGECSVKETLAHLARLDRSVYVGWLARLEEEERPTLPAHNSASEADANGRDPGSRPGQALGDLVADLRSARLDLIARVEMLPEAAWDREAELEGEAVTLYDLLLRVVRHDADVLRTLAYRLHEANLTGRPQDLPK